MSNANPIGGLSRILVLEKDKASSCAVLLHSREDKDDEQDERESLDDSAGMLCLSFTSSFRLETCSEITLNLNIYTNRHAI